MLRGDVQVTATRSSPWSRVFDRLRSRRVSFAGGRELWALLDQALVSGANFVTNVILARTLGLSGFGVYALSWSFVLLMSSLQTAFVVSPMMSIGPKQSPESRSSYFGATWSMALLFALCGGACIYSGIVLFGHWHPQAGASHLAAPVALAAGAYLIQDFTRRYFFTLGSSRLALGCDAVSYLTQLPVLWWFGRYGTLTIQSAYWTIGLTSLLGALVSVPALRGLRFSTEAIGSTMRRNSNLVRWLVPSALLQWLSLNLFMVFAPVYYGTAAAGALRACQNLVAVAHVWFLGLDNVIPVEAAQELHKLGVDSFLQYLRKVTIRWGFVTVLFMGAMSLAPAFWLHLLYGTRFVQFGYILRLYSVLYVMIFLGGPLRGGLQAIEFTSPLLWAYAAVTTFAAIAAAPMARQLGLPGVMAGLIATQVVFQAILATALFTRTNRIRRSEGFAALSLHCPEVDCS